MTTSTNIQSADIAVIGAGLGGLVLALFLRRAGLKSTVFELRPRSAEDGGYLALAPNALAILDDLGIYQSLLPQGFAYEEIAFLSARNCSRIGGVLNGSRSMYGYPALRISRHIVRQALLKAAEEAGVEIKFDSKVTGIKESEGNVTVDFQNGETKAFNYVIGADGIHSRVRKLVSSIEPTWSGQMGIGGGRMPRSDVDEGLALPCLFIGRSNAFMMMPTVADGSIVSFFATVETEGRSRGGWSKLGKDKEEIAKMLRERHCDSNGEWPNVVERACGNADAQSLTIWPHFHAPVLESWISKSSRVILIGDAAHAMPPTGGQGAAMAFEDAASLAKVFAEANTSGEGDLATALHHWQGQRQDRVRKIKAFTARSGDTRKATSSRLQQIFKEYAMWIFFMLKGDDGGFAWIYSHREEGPGSRV